MSDPADRDERTAASDHGRPSTSAEVAVALARLLDEHKGADTVVLEVAGLTPIADWFVITTARSATHLAGLAREVHRLLHAIGLTPLGRRKRAAASGWLLVDCGDVIVHLMEQAQREFYDLERLWFKAGRSTAQEAERITYSSKSS